MAEILTPKEFREIDGTADAPFIFLAGPILGGADWQAEMTAFLVEQNPNVKVAVPIRWKDYSQLPQGRQYLEEYFSTAPGLDEVQLREALCIADHEAPRQLDWEMFYIQKAATEENSCVVLNLPEESSEFPHLRPSEYAMNTRGEAGFLAAMYAVTKGVKVVVGGSRSFPGQDEIMRRFRIANRGESLPFYESPESLGRAALQLATES